MRLIRTMGAAALLLSAAVSESWAQGTFEMDPARIADGGLTPGSQITVTVKCTATLFTNAIDFAIDFNPTILSFVRGDLGSYWTVLPPFVLKNADAGGMGHYWFAGVLLGGFAPPGDYTVVTLTFDVIGTGTTDLAFGAGDDVAGTVTTPVWVDDTFTLVVPDTIINSTFSNVSWSPTLLEQSDAAGGTAMPVGFSDGDGVVALRGALSVPGLVQVEVKPEGVPFDEIDVLDGSFVPAAGSVSEVVVTGLAGGAYHWRARAINELGEPSGWTEFDPAPGADFAVAGASTGAPGGGSSKSGGCSASASRGGSVVMLALVLGGLLAVRRLKVVRALAVVATLACAASTARAQGISVDPARLNDGSATPGQTITVTVNCTGLVDGNGVEFYLAFDTRILSYVSATPGSFWSAGPSLIVYSGLDFPATTSPPYTDWYRISGVLMGMVTSGDFSIVTLKFKVLSVGSCDLAFYMGPKVYGDAPLFTVLDPVTGSIKAAYADPVQGGWFSNVPWDPTALEQSDAAGGQPMPPGFSDGDGVVALRGALTGPGLVQVEVKPEGVPFDEMDVFDGNFAPSAGDVSEAVVTGLAAGAYHWRARAINELGEISGWVEFASASGPDFAVAGASASGGADSKKRGCSASVAGSGGGLLVLALVLCGLMAVRR